MIAWSDHITASWVLELGTALFSLPFTLGKRQQIRHTDEEATRDIEDEPQQRYDDVTTWNNLSGDKFKRVCESRSQVSNTESGRLIPRLAHARMCSRLSSLPHSYPCLFTDIYPHTRTH